jgi:hypothetical protein
MLQVVADFQREGGDGEALQASLEARAAEERNWMEEWWEQLAYLRTRTTMAVHINWFGVTPDLGMPLTNTQSAALLIQGVLQVRSLIEAGQYKTETMRGTALDMHQFARCFGMTRVPGEGADTLQQAHDSRHVAVLRGGAVVAVPVYDSAGRPLSLEALHAQLVACVELLDVSLLEDPTHEPDAARNHASLLTALPRDEWAAERALLLDEPTSAASLKLVEEVRASSRHRCA